MSEYIDRDKLIEAIKEWQKTLIETYGKNDEYVRCLESVLTGIESIPAADVRPVVRGEDVRYSVNEHCEFMCSVCGAWAGEVAYGTLDGGYFNFCPNCGASMMKEES